MVLGDLAHPPHLAHPRPTPCFSSLFLGFGTHIHIHSESHHYGFHLDSTLECFIPDVVGKFLRVLSSQQGPLYSLVTKAGDRNTSLGITWCVFQASSYGAGCTQDSRGITLNSLQKHMEAQEIRGKSRDRKGREHGWQYRAPYIAAGLLAGFAMQSIAKHCVLGVLTLQKHCKALCACCFDFADLPSVMS